MNIADLQIGQPDSLGATVLAIYARKPPEYAVYQTDERVIVHFADDHGKADEQRKSMAQLVPVRGEITGLVDGWRNASDVNKYFYVFWSTNGAKLRKRAEGYDRRVGDALVVGLEGDLTGAGALLTEIKDDILSERVGWSRFEYLLTALVFVIMFIIFGGVLGSLLGRDDCKAASNPMCLAHGTDLWRGAIAGAVGSFFSIALAIRGRTVLPDLNRTSNVTDAALRVAIGIIAAAVLVALVLAEFVRISIGSSSPTHASSLYIAIVGFLAGFAERLVPDLLAKAEARTGEAPVLRTPERDQDARPNTARAPAEGNAAGDTAPPPPDPVPEQAHEDGCVSDLPLADDEVTPDESLPAASGGVEAPEEEKPA